MIEFTDVVKSYSEGNYALNGVNMQIEDGEFCFLVGPSGSSSGSSMVDCTSYVHNSSGAVIGERTKAVVTKGTVGLVRQDVYEMFGSGAYGQIWGTAASKSYTGTAKGCWSVDSVGSSYSYYNNPRILHMNSII